jgi:flagellum-specific peptidoglycan hydrolase FlgJ
MTRTEFIAVAIAAARAASAVSGYPAGVTVAQAALESAWGRSRLSTEAHNYFGIKALRNRPTVAFPTQEFKDGVFVQTVERFARFDSMEECFRERDALIARVAAYAPARQNPHDPEAFLRGLRPWATDPKYVEKLLALYRANGFDQLDK